MCRTEREGRKARRAKRQKKKKKNSTKKDGRGGNNLEAERRSGGSVGQNNGERQDEDAACVGDILGNQRRL